MSIWKRVHRALTERFERAVGSKEFRDALSRVLDAMPQGSYLTLTRHFKQVTGSKKFQSGIDALRARTPEKMYLALQERSRQEAELKKLSKGWSALRDASPSGDGHPVLAIPGFFAADDMLAPLVAALNEKGYKAYGWDAGTNLGLTEDTIKRLRSRLETIFAENGGQKVTLIGHSLGGMFARELAREYPDMVRDVISVGSPFGVGVEKSAVASWFRKFIELMGANRLSLGDEDMAHRCLTPPSMPTTSIFSKTDPVAGWEACLNPDVAHAENIHVDASHMGIINCLETYEIILDRLSQPEGAWQPHKNPAADAKPKNPDWKAGSSPKDKLFRKK